MYIRRMTKWYRNLIRGRSIELGLIFLFVIFLPVITISVCIILIICPICMQISVSVYSSACILLRDENKMSGRERVSIALNMVINLFTLSFLSYVLVRGSIWILSWTDFYSYFS